MWFPRGVEGRGTDRRNDTVPAVYRRKLSIIDRKFHGTEPGRTGPLVRRLESYGKLECLVVGPWGEGSKDLHSLIRVLGESRVAYEARAQGKPASDKELGSVIGQIRRVLSVTFVRAQSACLLARLGYLGEGARSAADRRMLAKRMEEARRLERQANHSAHIRGRMGRVGDLFV